ncbi:MAG: VCBS repeat-containing protein, partial [Planctomycetota bacterium]
MLALLPAMLVAAQTPASPVPLFDDLRFQDFEVGVGELSACPGQEVVAAGLHTRPRVLQRDPATLDWRSVPLAPFLPSGAAFSSVSVVDVDEDGRSDIVLGGWTDGVLFNDTPPGSTVLDFEWVEHAQSSFVGPLAGVADMDGDGRGDLVFTPRPSFSFSYRLAVVYRVGERAFSPPAPLPLPLSTLGEVADFDHDGDGDIALVSGRRLEIHRNDGGSFVRVFSSPATVEVDIARVGDLDGDGELDVVALGGGRRIVLEGDGSFGFVSREAASATYPFGSLDLADVTGDGLDDLVLRQDPEIDWATWRPVFLRRTGPFSFAPDFEPLIDPDAGVPGPQFTSGQIADVDGDGLVDFVGESSATDLSLHRGTVDPTTGFGIDPNPLALDPPPVRVDALVPLDADGDGDIDLVTLDRGGLRVYEQQAPGLLARHDRVADTFAPDAQAHAAGRFGDETADGLAVVRADGELAVYARLVSAVPAAAGAGFRPTGRSLLAFDVDLDRDDDIVGVSADGSRLLVARQTAPGAFGAPTVLLDAPAGLTFGEIVEGDWNGDGAPDVAAVEQGGGATAVRVALSHQGVLAPAPDSIPVSGPPVRMRASRGWSSSPAQQLLVHDAPKLRSWRLDAAGSPISSSVLLDEPGLSDFDAFDRFASSNPSPSLHALFGDELRTYSIVLGLAVRTAETASVAAPFGTIDSVDVDMDGDVDTVLLNSIGTGAEWVPSTFRSERAVAFCPQPITNALGVAAQLRATIVDRAVTPSPDRVQ